MNVPPISEKRFTVDEYIAFEEKSDIRHEFHEGLLYPIVDDSSSICDENDVNSTYIVRYPSLIVEVLLKASYERTCKFNFYQTDSSIQYYLLVESCLQSVELYSRTEKEGVWTYQRFSKPSQIIEFPKINFQISLEDIYKSINISDRLSFVIEEKR